MCPDSAVVERSLTRVVAGARVPGLVEFVEANEPRLIAFNEYMNEAGDEVSVVQFHPDAASMEAHIAIIAERARAAYRSRLLSI